MSSGAGVVLDHAQLFDTVEAAIADLRRVYATTARDRFMVKRVVTPRQAAGEMRRFVAAGEGCGILFGPERAGLINDHVTLADTVLSVPLNPAFSSLNLAQAVLLVGYEWFAAGEAAPAELMQTGHSRAQSAQPVPACAMHRAGAAYPARRGHGARRTARAPSARRAGEPGPKAAETRRAAAAS